MNKLIILFFLFILVSCESAICPEQHILPKNYTGPVVIVHTRKNTEQMKDCKDTIIYKIPKDGVFMAHFPPNEGWSNAALKKFYYENGPTSKRINLPPENICYSSSGVNFSESDFKSNIFYKFYFVGEASDSTLNILHLFTDSVLTHLEQSVSAVLRLKEERENDLE